MTFKTWDVKRISTKMKKGLVYYVYKEINALINVVYYAFNTYICVS